MLFVRTVSVILRELYPPVILRELCPPSCHSEGAQRPKNLFPDHPGELLFPNCHPKERSDEGSFPSGPPERILRSAQDDSVESWQ